MTKVKNYIGIDISKDWLDVSVLACEDGDTHTILEKRFSNDESDLEKLKIKLLRLNVTFDKSCLVVCENTGIYKDPLVKFFTKQRCLFSIESGQRIKKSLGIQRGKNDLIDARRIAEYAFINRRKLTIWKTPRKEIQKLKDLLRNRDRLLNTHAQLTKSLTEFNQFYAKTNSKFFNTLNKAAISGIERSLYLINQEIDSVAKKDVEIQRMLKLIVSVPGIGPVTGLKLICYTNEFTACSNGKQLACYVGVAPFEHTSGSSVRHKSRVSPIANKRLKAVLHMGAMSAIRLKNGELGRYYQRKVAEGKNKMLALNAIKNKIILRVMAVIKRGTPYKTLPKFAAHTRQRLSIA